MIFCTDENRNQVNTRNLGPRSLAAALMCGLVTAVEADHGVANGDAGADEGTLGNRPIQTPCIGEYHSSDVIFGAGPLRRTAIRSIGRRRRTQMPRASSDTPRR